MLKEKINLQLFADGGGDGGAGGTTGGAAAAGQPGGTTVQGENGAPRQSLDELLKDPEYKAEYDSKFQKALDSRFKKSKAVEERQQKLSPVIDLLSSKYGVSPDDKGELDYDALAKAVTEDDSYYEQEALEKGLSVKELKHIKQLESENRRLQEADRLRAEEENKQAFYQKLNAQIEQAKQAYPMFDIKAESGNPAFSKLITSGVPVKTAYEVVHKDDILGGAMAYTANMVRQQVASAIRSGSQRPTEAGAVPGAAAAMNTDPRKYSQEYRKEIRDRTMRGEHLILD